MPTICLNMIVKNESKIIQRLLATVAPIIDCYCIHDTGSSDDTVDKIKAFAESIHLPGNVHHRPFDNFAASRSAALDDARNMADYVLLLDADMKLIIDPAFNKHVLDKDVYQLQQGSDLFAYTNSRLVRSCVAQNYAGVTHEYLNTGTFDGSPVISEVHPHLRIEDVGDGGSKSDKFERDIRLLTEGIRVEPNNGRYYFYLANTYNDTGKFSQAAEMYQKRIAMGGWDQELYYSMFKCATCYRSLQNEDLFLLWAMKAWLFRPSRIESIFELVKHYREKKAYAAAQCLYRAVANTPASSDALFVHKGMYDYMLDYEYSLLAFYAGDTTCHRIFKSLFETPHLNLYSQFNNYKFYVPYIQGRVIDLACNHPISYEGKHHVMHGSSPSIIPSETGYIVNVRLVNYTINASGGYDYLHQIVMTRNKRVTMTRDFQVLDETIYDDLSPPQTPNGWGDRRLQGIEDLRLFVGNNGIEYVGTMAHADGHIGTCTGLYKNPLQPRELIRHTDCEKNWVVIPDGRFIYSWHPFQVGTLENSTLSLTSFPSLPNLFTMARGSTMGAKFKDEIWLIVHFVHKIENEQRFYYHSIVVFDSNLKYLRHTFPFKFKNIPIEYCLGLLVEDDRIILSHSTNDSKSQLSILPHSAFNTLWV